MLRALGFQLAGQRVVARLRIDLFKSIIRQDVSFFDSNKVKGERRLSLRTFKNF